MKSLFICDCFIFSSYFIFTAYDKIIAFVAVSTGAASNQLTVDLADPEEIRVAHERKHMKKIMAFGKFRIRALCEMITGSMVFPVIWLVNIDEAGRILPDILSVPVSRSAEDLIDQPHIKGPVQIEYLPQFCKRTHEQVVYEFLQLTDWRLVGQRRIKRKYQKPAINRPGMTVLLSSVVREVLKIGIIVLIGIVGLIILFIGCRMVTHRQLLPLRMLSDSAQRISEGNYNDVNVLIGTNSDEGSMFTGILGRFTPEQYEQEMKESFPDPVWQQKFRKMYPGSTLQEAYDAHSDIFREAAFAWPTYAWANLQSKNSAEGKGKGKVYMFFFNHAKQNFFRRGQQTDRQQLTMHAGELGLTFGQLGGFGGTPNPSDEALSRMVMQYWINFIKTGDPNGGYLPYWPEYAKDTETVMNFRDGAYLTPIPNKPQLELWEDYMQWRRTHQTPLK